MQNNRESQNREIRSDDPGQGAEIENAVLGSFFLDAELIHETNVLEDYFIITANRIIYQAIKKVIGQNKPLDVVSLTIQLAQDNMIENVGGTQYLQQLSESVPTVANFQFYEQELIKKHHERLIKAAASEYLNNPTEEALEGLQGKILEAQEGGIKTAQTTNEILYEIFEEMYEDQGEISGIPTKLEEIDRMTAGWQGGDLIILAARPSVGKTALGLEFAKGAAESDCVVDIFSLEMPGKQLVKRMLSNIGKIEGTKWRNPFLAFSEADQKKASGAMEYYRRLNINIHDAPGQTVADIRAAVRKTHRDNPGKKHLVLIDYLQLIKKVGKHERNDLAVGAITWELKLLARQLNISVILLSQLSRAVEQRQDKRPVMSDLRDSGSIEQDADLVAFLYRDDYYDKESDSKGLLEVIISKQRSGATGTVLLNFEKEYNLFTSLKIR